MNILLLGLVLYSYFVSSAPKVFKENKQIVLGIFIGATIYQMNLEGFTLQQCQNCCQNPNTNCYQSDEHPNLWGCIHPHLNLNEDQMCKMSSRPTHDCPDPSDSDFQDRMVIVRQSPDDDYYNSAWDPTVFAIGTEEPEPEHNVHDRTPQEEADYERERDQARAQAQRELELRQANDISLWAPDGRGPRIYNVNFDTTDFSN